MVSDQLVKKKCRNQYESLKKCVSCRFGRKNLQIYNLYY